MPSYSRSEVILVRYPFSDLSTAKVRPAVVVGVSHASEDSLIVPLTSRTMGLLAGEFALTDWREGTHYDRLVPEADVTTFIRQGSNEVTVAAGAMFTPGYVAWRASLPRVSWREGWEVSLTSMG